MATVPGTYIRSIEVPSPQVNMIGSPYGFIAPPQPIRVSGTTQMSIEAMQRMQGTINTVLQKYLYVPMNATTDYFIRRETATTIDTYLNYGTSTSATTDRYITDYSITPNFHNNTYDIEWNGLVTYTDNIADVSNVGGWADLFVPDKKQEAKIKFRNNLLIQVKSRAVNLMLKDLPQNEQIAIETLREEISETEFRKYMKCGFILVPAKSGKIYQVFRNKSHTKVWKGGKLIEEICVRIKNSNVPPTDNVIAFKTMIKIDEEEFRKMGNLYKMVA